MEKRGRGEVNDWAQSGLSGIRARGVAKRRGRRSPNLPNWRVRARVRVRVRGRVLG